MSVQRRMILALVLTLILVFSVMAEEGALKGQDAGIGPDSLFWFVDKLGENIKLSFTFNKEKKIEYYNKIMMERTLETKEMMLKAKFDAAKKSQKEYEFSSVLLSNYIGEVREDMSTKEHLRATVYSEFVQSSIANAMEEYKIQIRAQLQEQVTEEKIQELESELDDLADESRDLAQEVEKLTLILRQERPKDFEKEEIKNLETSLSTQYNVVLVVPEPPQLVQQLEAEKIAFENNKNCHLYPEQIQVGYDLSMYSSKTKFSYEDVLEIIDTIVKQAKKSNDPATKEAYYGVAIAIIDDVNVRYGENLAYWLSSGSCPTGKKQYGATETSKPVEKVVEEPVDEEDSVQKNLREKASEMLEDADVEIAALKKKIADKEADDLDVEDAETYYQLARTKMTLADKAYGAESYDAAYTYADEAFELAQEGLDDDNYGIDVTGIQDDIDDILADFRESVSDAWKKFESSKKGEYDCDREGDCDSDDEDDYEQDWDDGDDALKEALDMLSTISNSLEDNMILYGESLKDRDRVDYLNDLEDEYDELKDSSSDFEIYLDGKERNYYDIYDDDEDSRINKVLLEIEEEEDGDNDQGRIDDWQAEIDAYEEVEDAFLDYYDMLGSVIDEVAAME